jgi:threonine dehydrogenase-like Zn-dependent dehydrogenase
MASYMVFPAEAIVHKIAKGLEPAHAAFAEPLACGLHAVERANLRFDDIVVIAGCGPIGLSMVAGAVAKSPKAVIALDLSSTRLEIASLCGATRTIDISQEDPVAAVHAITEGFGADVYLEATGHPASVPQGLNILRKRGTFVEYGVFAADVTVDWSIISDDKELSVLGAHLGPNCWPTAIKMLEAGGLPMDRICTHRLPLERFQEGLDLVGDGSASIKVSLIPD